MSTTPDLLTMVSVDGVDFPAVASIDLVTRMNRPAEARVVVKVPPDTAIDALLGGSGVVGFGLADPDASAPMTFHQGVVVEVSVAETNAESLGALTLELTIASAMWLLQETHDSRVFLDLDVKGIITQVCKDAGINDAQLEFNLEAAHDKWPMTNQYDESSFAFVSRLCEQEGISWSSQPTNDGEKIVFRDKTSSADPVPGAGLRFVNHEGMAGSMELFTDLRLEELTTSGKVTIRDYDFTRPKLDITGDVEAADDSDLEVYDYGDNVTEPAQAKARAKVRLEALVATKKIVEIVGRSTAITVGHIVKLTGTPASLDGEYFVVALEQKVEASAGTSLLTRASLIPKDVPYRAPLVTPRPTVSGIETATVVAPKGSDVETIHTDDQGRVKVKLPWDRSDRVDDDTSHWARVMQLQTYDSLILPRIGWEVIVDYLEGDPDRPIVIGRVYNGVTMPPYALPEGKTRTALQSASSPGGGGRNEIRMEDKAGSEEVSVTAEKDHTTAIAGDKTVSVVSNSKKDIGANSSTTISGNHEIEVTAGYENGAASHTATISGSRNFTVAAVLGWAAHGTGVSSIGGSHTEMISDPLKGLLSLAGQVAMEAVQAEAQNALSNLEGAVGAKIDQAMGPVNDMVGQVNAAGQGLAGGPGQMAGALGALGSIPSPGDIAKGMVGDGTSAVSQAVTGAIGSAGSQAMTAMGLDPGDAAGSSEANAPGVDGAAGGSSASQTACGPGHSITKIAAASTETVSGSKLVVSAGKVVTSITGARTTHVSAAQIELAAGDRVENCLASKTEKSVGMVSLAKGDEIETVKDSRTIKVGGAVLEKISGGASIESGGSVLMAGAYWQIEAESSITLKVGGATVTIGDGGVSVAAPLITITAAKLSLTSSVAEK